MSIYEAACSNALVTPSCTSLSQVVVTELHFLMWNCPLALVTLDFFFFLFFSFFAKLSGTGLSCGSYGVYLAVMGFASHSFS